MDIKTALADTIKKQTGLDIANLLEIPPEPKLGDFALPCFKLSAQLKKSPQEIAKELKEKIKSESIEKSEIAGSYLNFYLSKRWLAKQVLVKTYIKSAKQKKTAKTVIVEFPSPNTNKPLHLGHLRNMSIGESVSRLFEMKGYKVIRANLNNDRGIHICKSMLAYKKFSNNKLPDKKPDHFVGDFYVMFENEAKKDENILSEAQELLRKWEAKDKETIKLWKKMNSWALKGFEQTYKRFGLKKFDRTYFESETYDKGREMIFEGLKKGMFKKDEDGSIYVDLGGELGKKILIRADGTTLYITQDIYLAVLKYKEYKFYKSVYVVASEQNYHFKVLFTLLKMLGYDFDCHHLSYGMVMLPEGRMKSREGKVVDADDLMDELKQKILEKHKIKNKTAEKIMLSAIKYYLLKFSAHKDFTFRPEESISFEGETGPYLQYALVRAGRILDRAGKPGGKVSFNMLSSEQEFMLIKKLSEFDNCINKAVETYSPNIIANYAYELAQAFSIFYENCPVLNADKELRNARLLLVKSFHTTLKTALYLLGIEEVKEM